MIMVVVMCNLCVSIGTDNLLLQPPVSSQCSELADLSNRPDRLVGKVPVIAMFLNLSKCFGCCFFNTFQEQ